MSRGIVKVLSFHEKQEWHRLLAKAGGGDVYYLPQYLELYSSEGEPTLFAIEKGSDCLVFPFLKRPLTTLPFLCQPLKGYYDITTPYGYGGPYTEARGEEGKQLMSLFDEQFKRYLADHGIVSVFLRYHPLLENYNDSGSWIRREVNGQTVAMDLDGGEQHIWKHLSRTTRNRVRKGLNGCLSFREGGGDQDWQCFFRLYQDTMIRKHAQPYYFFPYSYFQSIRKHLSQQARLFFVEKDGHPLSAGLFFLYKSFIHYHLGASDPDGLEYAPNNLLFYQTSLWGAARGYSKLHLGGGYGSSSDNLHRFKQGFNTKSQEPFYVGKIIAHPQLYDWLVEQKFSGEEPLDDHFFPLYRR